MEPSSTLVPYFLKNNICAGIGQTDPAGGMRYQLSAGVWQVANKTAAHGRWSLEKGNLRPWKGFQFLERGIWEELEWLWRRRQLPAAMTITSWIRISASSWYHKMTTCSKNVFIVWRYKNYVFPTLQASDRNMCTLTIMFRICKDVVVIRWYCCLIDNIWWCIQLQCNASRLHPNARVHFDEVRSTFRNDVTMHQVQAHASASARQCIAMKSILPFDPE